MNAKLYADNYCMKTKLHMILLILSILSFL